MASPMPEPFLPIEEMVREALPRMPAMIHRPLSNDWRDLFPRSPGNSTFYAAPWRPVDRLVPGDLVVCGRIRRPASLYGSPAAPAGGDVEELFIFLGSACTAPRWGMVYHWWSCRREIVVGSNKPDEMVRIVRLAHDCAPLEELD